MKKRIKNGFTRIELLVVIAILGLLMGLLGPKVFELLGGANATKTQAVFRSWVTQLYQYKEFYKYFPPFLLEREEGVPVVLSESDEVHNSFVASLRGMKWTPGTKSWEKLTDDLLNQNLKRREFHSFSESEFGSVDPDNEANDGQYLSDAWGGRNIQIVVDQDGDGLIELSSDAVNQIKNALKHDFSSEVVDNAAEKFKVIRDKVGIFVLYDPAGYSETHNVFSWDLVKYLGDE